MDLEEFFEGYAASRPLFDELRAAIESLGQAQMSVSTSQIAFSARRAFAWAWVPARYLGRGAPLVLSVALSERDGSPRWKQIVEPAPGRFMHHLELQKPDDIDAEVLHWLASARELAEGDGA